MLNSMHNGSASGVGVVSLFMFLFGFIVFIQCTRETVEYLVCVSQNSRKLFRPEKVFYAQAIYQQRFSFRLF